MRVIRGFGAALAATTIALIGHLLGGGELPTMLGVAVPLVVSTLVAIPLIGRSLSLWRTASVVVLSQLAFHWLFVLGSTGTATTSGAEMPGMQHAMAGSVEVSAHTMATPAMSFGHIAAAAFTIVALFQGERVLRQLLALAVGWVRTVFRLTATPIPVHVRTAVPSNRVEARQTLLSSDLSRRGPPAAF